MCRNKSIQKNEENYEINNWLVAISLSFSFINGVVGFSGISILTLLVICFLMTLSIRGKKIAIYPVGGVIIIAILLCFLVSFFRVRELSGTVLYLKYFFAFGIILFVAGMQDICVGKVIVHINRIGLVGIIIWICQNGHLLTDFSSNDSPHLMGMSYAILPILFSSLIGVLYEFKTRMTSIINIALIIYMYMKIAPRGIWVIVLSFFGICFFNILNRTSNKTYRFFMNLLLLSITIVALAIIFSNFTKIVLAMNSFLYSRYGVRVYALQKYANYLGKGNILNGRSQLWKEAILYIGENPIFGKGIGYFEAQGDGGYTHNIFLQLMCEGGILLLAPVLLMIIESICIILKTYTQENKTKYLFFTLVFLCGIEMLLYSSVYWIYTPFWFYLGFFCKTISHKNEKIRIKI